MKFISICSFLFLSVGLCSCMSMSSIPLKSIKELQPKKIELSLIAGNLNVEKYKTISRIKVYTLKTKIDAKKRIKEKSKKLTEQKLEISSFDLNRQTLAVSENGQAQFKYWVTNVEGDVDLLNMGLPPQGKTLSEVVDKKGKVLAVKGFPEESIFYLPKIALPEKAVKVGDEWVYQDKWRSLKTGWPFEVKLRMTLKSWVSCGGLRCAHIKYDGGISLPKESPLKEAVLKSTIKGEFVYAPIGHQFIWSYSKSVETFTSSSKIVDVKSCTASYQISPDKEASVFSKKLRKFCN